MRVEVVNGAHKYTAGLTAAMIRNISSNAFEIESLGGFSKRGAGVGEKQT